MTLTYISSMTPQYSADDYLYHHGIKGMHWGVRRYRNYDGTYTKKGLERYRKADDAYTESAKKAKEIKAQVKEGKATKEELRIAKAEKKLGVDKMKAEAHEYAKKHGLDEDDGGGGDPDAGDKYMQMQEKIASMDEKAWSEGSKYAKDTLDSKYGDQTFEDLLKENNRVGVGKAVAAAAMTALGKMAMKKLKDKIDPDGILDEDETKSDPYDDPFWGNPKSSTDPYEKVNKILEDDEPHWGSSKSSTDPYEALNRILDENEDEPLWGSPKSSGGLSSILNKRKNR